MQAVDHLRLELDDVDNCLSRVDQRLHVAHSLVAFGELVGLSPQAVDHLPVAEKHDRVHVGAQHTDEAGIATLAKRRHQTIERDESGAQRLIQRSPAGDQQRILAGVVRSLLQVRHLNHA